MPNPGAELPLRKVTLNLFDHDVETLKNTSNRPWTELVRDLVHQYCVNVRAAKRTIGDLDA